MIQKLNSDKKTPDNEGETDGMRFRDLCVVLTLMTLCPLAKAWAPWRFIYTADSRSESPSDNAGVNVAILSEIVSEVLAQNAEFLCFGGDLCVGLENQTILEEEFLKWRQTVQPLYQAGFPVYIIRGNHDEGDPAGTTAWNNVFKDFTASGGLNYGLPQNGPDGEKNLTYAVAHKNVFILALDQLVTPNHGKNRVAQAWIDQQLAANTQPHVFPFGHFTAFKMIWDSFGDYPADRDRFWQSIARAGCRAYFCGHEHFYHEARVDSDGNNNNDLYQVVVGSAGASIHIWDGKYIGNNGNRTLTDIYHTTRFGYIVVDVRGYDITLTWMERDSSNQSIRGHYLPIYSWSWSVPIPKMVFADFVAIAENWLSGDCGPCGNLDLSGDGNIGLDDLLIFIEHWLVTPPAITEK